MSDLHCLLDHRAVLHATFMDLEKAFDKVEWTAMWDVLKVYGVGRRCLEKAKTYRNAEASIRVGGEMSEKLEIGRCEAVLCDVPVAV